MVVCPYSLSGATAGLAADCLSCSYPRAIATVVASLTWCVSNLVELFLSRLEAILEPRQREGSPSMIRMGRRISKVFVMFSAAIICLDNRGYTMATIIAGLGVGGIALALVAQSNLATIFGGVSVVLDRPVMVGDYGSFGSVLGTIESIGMRSARVRTLQRTMMSIPKSSFATMKYGELRASRQDGFF